MHRLKRSQDHCAELEAVVSQAKQEVVDEDRFANKVQMHAQGGAASDSQLQDALAAKVQQPGDPAAV